jgi:uncharacterized protein YjdB
MMKKCLYFGLVALLFLAACARNEEMDTRDANMTLIAKTESSSGSRTFVGNETHVLWEPGDAITVFAGGKRGSFYAQLTEPSDTAPFRGYWEDDSNGSVMDMWALYPDSWDASFDDESITTILPSRQEAREGSFGREMNLAIAHSTTGTLQFYNVGGGVRFSVQEDGIREVVLSGMDGEVLAGKVRIGFQDGRPAVLDVREGKRSISLYAPYPGTFKKDTWYYFVAIPGTLEKGFVLDFFQEDGHGTRVFEKTVTVKRSIYGTLTHADSDVTYSAFSNGSLGFVDDQVKTILTRYFDLDRNGKMSLLEAAVVRSFQLNETETRADDGKESIFAGTDITSFDELVFFTGLTRIEEGVFAGCTGLTSVTIPESVTSIGDNAFNGCIGLQSITLKSTIPPSIGTGAFDNTGDCPISVPEDVVDEYVSAWSEYAPRIQAAVLSYAVPEAVDLGLPSGVKWASFNLGASKPEEYGYYYAWGETEPKSFYTERTYQWFSSGDGGEGFTKYCFDPDEGYNGFVDNKGILDPEDDAAHVNLGDDWRMPTAGEWSELVLGCTLEWTSVNGLNCLKATGPNGNSIILPPGGAKYAAELEDEGSMGGYWSSSNSVDACYAWGFGYGVEEEGEYTVSPYGNREMGVLIRPVSGTAPILAESISLDRTTLDLKLGEVVTLSVSYQPENVTHKLVYWESSNKSVVTVSETGELKALKAGEATIGAMTIDGCRYATCEVKVTIPEPVDLGLPSGIRWASFNLEPTSPYGDYYAWGETKTYYEPGDAQSESPRWRSDWDNYSGRYLDYENGGYCWDNYAFSDIWYDDDGISHLSGFIKYPSGNDKHVLEPEDDVAHVLLGGEWRMPSWAEMKELIDQCVWEWTIQDNLPGQRVTGPNGNSIFLPAAGYRNGLGLKQINNEGRYWTSSLYFNSTQAMLLYFSSDADYIARSNRYIGYSIRPIQGYASVPVESIVLDQTEIILHVGETVTMNATVLPENATFPGFSCYYSYPGEDPIDLEWDQNSVTVTAIAGGNATITVFSLDGWKTTTCKVIVQDSASE